MHIAINFNDERFLGTAEVHNESANLVLPAKLAAIKLPVS